MPVSGCYHKLMIAISCEASNDAEFQASAFVFKRHVDICIHRCLHCCTVAEPIQYP